jgi:peptide/nickel transport system permease protein
MTRAILRELRRNRPAAAALAVIVLTALAALFAPVITRFNPTQQDLLSTFLGPGPVHWLGTDNLGRDMFSRLVYGARLSLAVGVLSIGFGGAVGIALGLLTGYYGGWVDVVFMRLVDLLLSFPGILLAILIASRLGSGLVPITMAIGIYAVPGFARLVRGDALALKEREFVDAARAAGAGAGRLLLKHVLRNDLGPIIVYATLLMGNAMLAAAALSFLGVGFAPPTPEWGSMIQSAQEYIISSPYLMVEPGVALFVVVLSFNVLGDFLRDVLDPRGSPR